MPKESINYPRVLYAKWSDETGDTDKGDTDDRFLVTDESEHRFTEPGKSVRVAVYEFAGFAVVENVIRVVRQKQLP